NPETLNLGDENSLAVKVAGDKLTCRAELKLVGEALSGKITVQESPAHVTARFGGKEGAGNPHLNEAGAEPLCRIGEIVAQMQISGTLTAPKWTIQSNLGRQVAGGLGSALSKQFEGQRAALASQLDQQLRQHSGRLQDIYKQNMQGITAQLNGHEQ